MSVGASDTALTFSGTDLAQQPVFVPEPLIRFLITSATVQSSDAYAADARNPTTRSPRRSAPMAWEKCTLLATRASPACRCVFRHEDHFAAFRLGSIHETIKSVIPGNWAVSSAMAGTPMKLASLSQKSKPREPGSVLVM